MGEIIYLDDISDKLINKAINECDKANPDLAYIESLSLKWIRMNDYNPSEEECKKRKNDFNNVILPKIKERINYDLE